MRKTVVFGYVVSLIGSAIWLYGYLASGSPPLVHWTAITPWWIADYLPNIQSEIGMALVLVSMVPIYWPARTKVTQGDHDEAMAQDPRSCAG